MLTEELEPDVIVFNNELTPSQIRNLSSVLDARVIDRTQLILDILRNVRSREREASSRISSVAIYNAASYGTRIVFITSWWWYWNERAGETKLETDRRHIRSRIDEIKKQLAVVVEHRKDIVREEKIIKYFKFR